MRIVFYTSFSSERMAQGYTTEYFPSAADLWEGVWKAFPEDDITVLCSATEIDQIPAESEHVHFRPIAMDASIAGIADVIEDCRPDAAVAISRSAYPFDWNPIKDSMIAEELERRGIHTIAHPTFLSVGCADKWRSNLLMRVAGLPVLQSVYVDMNMFWCEKTMDAIPVNVYREYILQRLRQLSYPVIVKGIFGTGGKMITCDSFEVLNDFLLNSNPDSQDYYVEEKAEGEELGVEIYGRDGSYEIGPFLYLNTEKKGYDYFRQNLKFGPVTDEKYGLDGLREKLCYFAKAARLCGGMEIDLIYRDGRCYLIDLNPRWSGLSKLSFACAGTDPMRAYADLAHGGKVFRTAFKPHISFRVTVADDRQEQALRQCPHVIAMTLRKPVPQGGKPGTAKVIYGGFDSVAELIAGLKTDLAVFPEDYVASIVEKLESQWDRQE